MAKSIRIKDANGDYLYPQTLSKNIVHVDGSPVLLMQPDGFPILPYNVYKQLDGTYETEDILATREESFTAYYVDTESGSDSNNGLTEDSPFLTLKKALTTAAGKNADICIINDDAKLFFSEIYGNEYGLTASLIIRAASTATIINGVKEPGWTLADGYTSTYVSSSLSSYSVANAKGVCSCVDIDETNKDTMGIYVGYTYAASVEEVEATAGTYYYDSTNTVMYVHPRNTAETVHPMITTYGFRFSIRSTGNCMLYLENLNVIGGFYLSGRATKSETDTRTTEFIAKNCIFQHNFVADGVPASNFNVVYMVDCRCGYSQADCYNYHATNLTEDQILASVFVEVNCQAEEAGYYHHMFGTNSYIMNLSTAHEGINIARFNTTGRYGYGPMIADVNGCHSVCVDCHVFTNGKYSFNGTNAACFTFNEASAVHSGRAQLIDCYGYDDRTGFYKLHSSVARTEVRRGNLLTNGADFVVTGDLMIKNR